MRDSNAIAILKLKIIRPRSLKSSPKNLRREVNKAFVEVTGSRVWGAGYTGRGLTTFTSFHAPHVPLTDLYFFYRKCSEKKKKINCRD